MKSKCYHLLAGSLFCLSAFCSIELLANSKVNALFEKLKTIPEDYKNFGTICERVAAIELAAQFPQTAYEILVGVEYSNRSRVIGELDVVVLERSTEEAVLIGEVKCSVNLSRALAKANSQLKRFRETITCMSRYGCQDISIFEKAASNRHFSFTQFDDHPQTITISQKNGTHYGFGFEISLSLVEARDLRDRLMRCQERGECAQAFDGR